MSTFYKILVFIHIFSAILGMGPGFVLNLITKSAKTMEELRHAYLIKSKVHIFVMVGGVSLLVSGLLMGLIHPRLFQAGWYVISLLLFIMTFAMGAFVLKPLTKPIKWILDTHQGNEIPNEYFTRFKKLNLYENISNLVFLTIILLMILKPF